MLSACRSSATVLVVLFALLAAACVESPTETPDQDVRLFFRNDGPSAGPCQLILNFGGGVKGVTDNIDYEPRVAEENSVPVIGAGTVSLRLGPGTGSSSCGFTLRFSDGGPSQQQYVLKSQNNWVASDGEGAWHRYQYCSVSGSLQRNGAQGLSSSITFDVIQFARGNDDSICVTR
jgi:hypothetical protein